MKKKIYLAAAIRGGRDMAQTYEKILTYLQKYGTILDPHVGDSKLSVAGEMLEAAAIYQRDMTWLKECDYVFAEVSTPSLGVGYEIATALNLGKKVICLFQKDTNLSAMLQGNAQLTLISYENLEDIEHNLAKIFGF